MQGALRHEQGVKYTLNLEDGAVVVAGGTGGIGESLCRKFAGCGLPLVFSYYGNREKADRLRSEIAASGGRCKALAVDVTSPPDVNQLFDFAHKAYGRVAHVVCATGPAIDFNWIGDLPAAAWKRVIETDLMGSFNLVQATIRVFRAQEGGNLVAIITTAVNRIPKADILSAAPKSAVQALIRGVANEYGRFGIRANCVAPGWINAGLGRKGLEEQLSPEAVEVIRRKTIPLRRFGTADDVANAVLYLCSREAQYITGQTLAVDGGAAL
jgi:NAD(P)-dependent dehydrogenase (short-subunit alcohol dehydrogenase family)